MSTTNTRRIGEVNYAELEEGNFSDDYQDEYEADDIDGEYGTPSNKRKGANKHLTRQRKRRYKHQSITSGMK